MTNQQIQRLLTKYGQPGLTLAKQTLQEDTNISEPIQKILTYFIEQNWPNTHHPALMALCCQAVGGNPELTERVGASVVLLTGAADIHDDLIDKSKTKAGKQTAFSKFDRDLVLLAGDVLFLKGYLLLQRACMDFPPLKQREVAGLIEGSLTKLSGAVVTERLLREEPVDPEAFHQMLTQKGAIAQACVEVGAVLADADEAQRAVLRRFGKTLGYLMTIKNEFSDLYDDVELRNRGENEILPLPLLYALKDPLTRTQIQALLQGKITKKKVQEIAQITEDAQRVIQLKTDLFYLKNNEQIKLSALDGADQLKLLLDSAVPDF
jgi:geranylgeranyl pyrophosphate synthase